MAVPKAYRKLAKAGQRYRYNGFWLGESPLDRTIAEWIDGPMAGRPTAVIKALLFMIASGQMQIVNSASIVMRDEETGTAVEAPISQEARRLMEIESAWDD